MLSVQLSSGTGSKTAGLDKKNMFWVKITELIDMYIIQLRYVHEVTLYYV